MIDPPASMPVAAMMPTAPASLGAPSVVSWLNVTFCRACKVMLPPLWAVSSVMLLPLEVIASEAPASSVFQFTRPPPVIAPEPVAAVSTLPVLVVPALSEAEPLAATEPCVAVPFTRTVCARTNPLVAVTAILPASVLAPVAARLLKVMFWPARMVCVPGRVGLRYRAAKGCE
ncbi:hypothetical protein [Bradyrhizobium sp. CB2312]|uniref:hypothetical protein n=1 Tax=Bradyrhizobium sp. CB2312 TaxID=3039155 RepID=UPI0024B1D637|nr:hypothetical protein [Bradyrhizobium sp. CB2312]WFU70014.1 hypothetical protein QA642_32695 [Bradyrhizobium sp. CB2312]